MNESELTVDIHGEYRTVWECEAPPMGSQYRVLYQEWNDDFTERRIKRIEMVAAGSGSAGIEE